MKNKNALIIAATAAVLSVVQTSKADQPESAGPPETMVHVPNSYSAGNHFGELDHAKTGGARRTSTIQYHGGPVMLGTVKAYVVWYGNWTNDNSVTIISDFLNHLGGSPYYNINTTYYNGSGTHLQNSISFAGSANDNYSRGSSLTDTDIQTIVKTAISANALPLDANGVYFVLTSADVAKSGFCSSYCGWHTHATISGQDIKYAFVGNAGRCLNACAAQSVGPNGNAGADGTVSIIAHELEESASDPDLNAWYDGSGAENADKCAWTFGTTYTTSNGSQANMHLGTRDYLIQQNWVNSGSGFCAQKYP
jgi:hypothetical protein